MGRASAVVDLVANDSRFNAAMRRVQSRMEAVRRSMEGVARAARRVFLVSAAGIGATIFIFGSFEQKMNLVKARTQAVGVEFEKLNKLARDLGKSTVFSANEVAEAMASLAQAGFTVKEIFVVLGDVLNLAAAGQLDMATAAGISAGILRGMKLEAKDLVGTVDVLSKAFITSNTELRELGEAMKFVGPVAAEMGLSIQETVAALQILAERSIVASIAGTTLRNSLIRLQGTKVTKFLDELDLSLTRAGDLIPFAERLDVLREGLATVGVRAEQATKVFDLFGQRAGLGMVILLDQGGKGLTRWASKLKDVTGFTVKVARTQLEGLFGDFEQLGGSAEEASIIIGGILAPSVSKITKTFESWIDAFSALDNIAKRSIVTWGLMGTAVAGFLAVSVPALAAGIAFVRVMRTMSAVSAVMALAQAAATKATAAQTVVAAASAKATAAQAVVTRVAAASSAMQTTAIVVNTTAMRVSTGTRHLSTTALVLNRTATLATIVATKAHTFAVITQTAASRTATVAANLYTASLIKIKVATIAVIAFMKKMQVVMLGVLGAAIIMIGVLIQRYITLKILQGEIEKSLEGPRESLNQLSEANKAIAKAEKKSIEEQIEAIEAKDQVIQNVIASLKKEKEEIENTLAAALDRGREDVRAAFEGSPAAVRAADATRIQTLADQKDRQIQKLVDQRAKVDDLRTALLEQLAVEEELAKQEEERRKKEVEEAEAAAARKALDAPGVSVLKDLRDELLLLQGATEGEITLFNLEELGVASSILDEIFDRQREITDLTKEQSLAEKEALRIDDLRAGARQLFQESLTKEERLRDKLAHIAFLESEGIFNAFQAQKVRESLTATTERTASLKGQLTSGEALFRRITESAAGRGGKGKDPATSTAVNTGKTAVAAEETATLSERIADGIETLVGFARDGGNTVVGVYN